MSIVTPWESARNHSTGKLDAEQSLEDIESGRLNQNVRLLSAKISHVISTARLPRRHRDPFDRPLIAQALDWKIPIVSHDRMFDRYGVRRIWD